MITSINDGTEDQPLTIARNCPVGALGKVEPDRYLQRGVMQVLDCAAEVPRVVEDVADLAQGASRLAAATITSTRRMSTTVGDD